MKTELICRNVKRKAVLASLMSAGLKGLLHDPRVREVRVQTEYCPNSSPAYRVRGRLALMGPDVNALGEGHTLEAAVLLVVRQFERGLWLRHRHQELNRLNRLQTRRATRDRFRQVWASSPNCRCPAAYRQKQPYQYVMF